MPGCQEHRSETHSTYAHVRRRSYGPGHASSVPLQSAACGPERQHMGDWAPGNWAQHDVG